MIWVVKLVQLNLASDNLNSWREVSYLRESHKLSESGAIPERSNICIRTKCGIIEVQYDVLKLSGAE